VNQKIQRSCCHCQHCSGKIEFDCEDFKQGETRLAECPHCHLETKLYIPNFQITESSMPKPPIRFLAKELVSAIFNATGTQRFERAIFTTIRLFALFWASLMLLSLGILTLNYIGSFFTSKPATGENSNSPVSRIMASEQWQNFGIYLASASVLLTMLTFVSIVLVLIAIERNTRKNEKAD
jgi:hypothetical protein